MFRGSSSGTDRAVRLFEVLSPGLPEALQTSYSSGLLAIGEINSRSPDLRSCRIGEEGFVILYSSMMMDFVYAVLRACAGVTVRRTASGPANVPPLGVDAVASLVADTFRQWARSSRWPCIWNRIDRPDFPIAEAIQDRTESLEKSTELFMLAHELGHVALDLGVFPRVSGNEEEDADRCGVALFLPSAQGALGLRDAFFGPVFAARIFAGLKALRVKLAGNYPDADRRVELLIASFRSQCPNQQYFHEASTVMFAYLDMMDSVDKIISKRAGEKDLQFERVLVRLIAELQELSQHHIPRSEFIAHVAEIAERAPSRLMRDVGSALILYYQSRRRDGYLPLEMRLAMGNELGGLIPQLPNEVRDLMFGASQPSEKTS